MARRRQILSEEDFHKKIKLTTLDIRGETVQVYVRSDGYFFADYAAQSVSASELTKLVPKLMALSRKKKTRVQVPASLLSFKYGALNVQPILLTGINARTDAVEWKHDAPHATDTQQLNWHRDDNVLKPLTDKEIQQAKMLYGAHHAAEEAWREFKRKHQIEARQVVLAAIEKESAEDGPLED